MTERLLIGDCRERLAELPDNSVDSVCCDPPYHLTTGKKGGSGDASVNINSPAGRARISTGFMGQQWDGGDVAFDPATWAEVLRVLKPGGHLAAFGGTRTYHRMAVAIEDAGFEIRDQLAWVYGSGFPKSLDVSKAIDKAAGAEREVVATWHQPGRGKRSPEQRYGLTNDSGDITAPATEAAQQWQGWGTALKPSWEPICLARKPLIGSVAQNVLTHGTGALNIDGCRIETQGRPAREVAPMRDDVEYRGNALEGRVDGSLQSSKAVGTTDLGRWPANLCHDGSEEVSELFPEQESGGTPPNRPRDKTRNAYGTFGGQENPNGIGSTRGSAARFFYCAKAGKLDRLGSDHPTVKPVALMRWLVRLITPPGGLVLDPFAGTGSTGIAALIEGFDAILVELRDEAATDIQRRLDHIRGLGRMTALELATKDLQDVEKVARASGHGLPLFGGEP